jgi:hypothetical protein
MIISGITSKTGPRLLTGPSAAHTTAQTEPVTSRALVPVERPLRASAVRMARPDASFVAHLIAMAEQAPQTRTLRRAAPAVAHGAYGRATARVANCFGEVLSRTV